MLNADAIRDLLQRYLECGSEPRIETSVELFSKLERYLELLLRWNSCTNLTAIRDPEEIVRRHFGESLFLGRRVFRTSSFLDYGSGAGFPGIPVQLLRPEIHVTLAESQGKKAAFLREVVRDLRLGATVQAQRVEAMPPSTRFGAVGLRAVDDMSLTLRRARKRSNNIYALLTQKHLRPLLKGIQDWSIVSEAAVPDSEDRVLLHLSSEPGDCSTWNVAG